jgi:hypothetical protein
LQDDGTGEPFEVDLPIDINFFWPSVWLQARFA